MAQRKSKGAGKRAKGDDFMKQMGLLGAPGDNDDDDDIDLEAELRKLNEESDAPKTRKAKKKAEPVDLESLSALANNIVTDIGSDEELSGDDDDFLMELEALGSGDEEEEAPAPVTKVASKPATPQKPSAASVSSPQKPKPASQPTISKPPPSSQPAAAVASKPLVASKPTAASPAQLATTSTDSGSPDRRMTLLQQRRAQYNNAAARAKQSGDEATARKYMRIRKDFDNIIEAVQNGQDIDLSAMPPAPVEFSSPAGHQAPSKAAIPPAASQQVQAKPAASIPSGSSAAASIPPEASAAASGLSVAETISALQVRIEKYKESEAQANEQGNSSKARRLGRVVKQFNDAVKATKAGRPFEYSELPILPGFNEIAAPVSTSQASAKPAASAAAAAAPPAAVAAAKRPTQPAVPAQSAALPRPAEQSKPPPPAAQKSTSDASVKHKSLKRQATLSIQEKQLEQLQQRQAQYKKAALDAKTHDDKELAMKYMRIAKGMNPMIQAATNGLPVDMGQLPPPPTKAHDTGYVVVEESEISEVGTEERTEEYQKIITQLEQQIESSSNNAIHFKTLGDVKNSTVFQTYEENCRKDLDAVQNALRHNDPAPKYHYETRQYTMVKVNTDLGDSDFQIKIIKGIQYPLPSGIDNANDLDTQVFYEFAFPQDNPQKGHTDYSKHSDNPEYNHTAMLKIDRRSKSMLRFFKNRKLKLELFYRRGFLKSDKHFATVSVKLDELETMATLHRSFDLLDTNGRKEIGGKLEVILRLREPLTTKQVEVIKDKWLIIDQFVRLNRPVHKDPPVKKSTERVPTVASQQVSNVQLQSLHVLKFEKKELDNRIRQLSGTGQLKPEDLLKLTQKSGDMTAQIDGISMMMKRNQLSPHDYIQVLTQIHAGYVRSIQAAAQNGDRKRQQILGVKKDIVHREIREMQGKAGDKS